MNRQRTIWLGLAVCALAFAPRVNGQTASLQDLAGALVPGKAPATIYVARSFLTMNAKQPRAECVAVREGRFVAVGSRAECEAVVGRDAKVDATFEGKTAIAGFVEQHVHPLLAALTMNTKVISIEDWDAIDGFSPAVRDPKTYEKRLTEALAAHKDRSKPFVTWGYHHYLHGDRMSRAYLDGLAPEFPVIVWHRSCHEFYLNSKALTAAGIDQAVFDAMPASAREQANLERGHFFEQGAMPILGKLAPLMTSAAEFSRGLEYTEQYYHRAGITTACEPGGFFSKPLQDAINAVYSDDATPFNHFFIADGKSFAARNPTDGQALVADTEQVLTWGKGRTAYLPKQAKLLSDGAIFSQLMKMKSPYSDGHQGAWIMDPPLLDHAFQSYWNAGYQIHVHNNGDAGLDVLLASLEKAMARKPRVDHRSVLVHFGFAQEPQVKRWIALGGIVSSNPYYVTALAGPYATIGLGPERARNIAPHRFVLENRGSLSFHSDMPMAPARPLDLVWAGVTRLTYEGKVAGPEHRVSLDTALRAITIEAAYSIQLEKKVGSIEVGKDANLTILEKNPFDVDPAELKGIGVWGTMLEGRLQPVVRKAPTASTDRRQPSPVVADSEVQSATVRQLERVLADRHGF